MSRTRNATPLDEQIKHHLDSTEEEVPESDGNFDYVVSTGSTLLDLEIAGGRVCGGGIPAGILVEVYGPSGSGKTVLLSEVAGGIQRLGGDVLFHDPEARLNQQFARMFGLELTPENYRTPDRVPEVFKAVRAWEPTDPKIVNGIMADSLAALSTAQEMDNDDGDKMGMRRAKEFSEELRKTCRIIKQRNYLMICSNQVRVNVDAGPYGQKYTTPGGKAMEFYASLRLKTNMLKKHKISRTFSGKEIERIIGVRVEVEVTKSSIWRPYGVAPVTIIFDYGIDDIRENLQFIKDHSKFNVYTLGGEGLDKSINRAIEAIEQDNLAEELRNEVIALWTDIESKFKSERKPKR